MNTDKLVINWRNFARVRLQLKFAFIMRPLIACGLNIYEVYFLVQVMQRLQLTVLTTRNET